MSLRLEQIRMDAKSSVTGITLGPMYNCYVKVFIKEVELLEHVNETKELFVNKAGHPITKVEIFGIIMEVQKKEKCTLFTVDDCSGGKVKVILWADHSSEHPNINPSSLNSLPLLLQDEIKNVLANPKRNQLKRGVFVQVRGKLRINKFDGNIEINAKCLTVLTENVLDFWTEWIKDTAELHEKFYNKIEDSSDPSNDSMSDMFSQGLQTILKEKMNNIFFSSHSKLKSFYGYEVLEMQAIKDFKTPTQFTNILRNDTNKTTKEKVNKENCLPTESRKNGIIYCLKYFVSKGKLIEEKCQNHLKLTNISELDALYTITEKHEGLINFVRQHSNEHNAETFTNFKKLFKQTYPGARDNIIGSVYSVALQSVKRFQSAAN